MDYKVNQNENLTENSHRELYKPLLKLPANIRKKMQITDLKIFSSPKIRIKFAKNISEVKKFSCGKSIRDKIMKFPTVLLPLSLTGKENSSREVRQTLPAAPGAREQTEPHAMLCKSLNFTPNII